VANAPRLARDLAKFLRANRARIEEDLLETGAILFRGFDVFSVAQFDAAVCEISSRRLEYVYRSTPRTALGSGIFTATEYPPSQSIGMHCENAYQRQWPLKIVFGCLLPATSGGETPIADVRRVTVRLGGRLVDDFERRGVRYVRHYRPHVDLPWQTVFQVSDRRALAEFCARVDLSHEWLDEDTLRTAQVCQGTARHPITGDRLWFNQAQLFHSSSLGAESEAALAQLFGRDRLPRQAYFGDGGEIADRDLQAVRRAFEDEAVAFAWQSGDVLLLDNMRVAHGRRPFKGERKVIAALLEESVEREATPARASGTSDAGGRA
jgi:alpha-ketoglutarate-dependent taurine dioxygenase